MQIVRDSKKLKSTIAAAFKDNSSIGFVPTMGALHEGHISLIAASKKENKVTICSIFVNPVQFNNPEDFAKYPITLEQDINILTKAGCDLLFIPDVANMYPEGIEKAKMKIYDLNGLDTHLEGAARPGHFQGVALVVDRLLKMVEPNSIYMGIKDYQQCMVVRCLIEHEQIPTTLKICDTLREKTGLAMSSRNARLSYEAKEKAKVIHACLLLLRDNCKNQHYNMLKIKCAFMLKAEGLELEYITLAHAYSLKELAEFNAEPMVVLIAAHLEGVRLIDNMVIG
jgi:pantoate--beta-alanine ligase